MPMERKNKIPIEDVLPFVGKGVKEFDGVPIKMGSQRYKLFKDKGVNCVTCGAKGSFFAIERSYKEGMPRPGWHLNLYALNNEGQEVMMTKDHVIPRARGGKDVLSNYQPMCAKCNGEKADKL